MRHFVDQAGGTDLVYDDGIDTLKASFDYEMDDAGNRTGAQEIVDGQTYDWTWTYDDLNRLISEQLDAGDDSLDYTTTFGFDLASNRMEERKDTGSDGATTPDEVTTYDYDANDRLLTERADTNDDGTTDQTTAYAYGANADLGSGYGGDGTSQTEKTVRDGDAVTGTFTSRTTFEYNAMGRLAVSETFSNGSSTPDTGTTYTYDDRGLRVTETTSGDGGETKEYLFDPNNPTGYAQVLEQYVNDVLHRTYTLGNDVISQADTAAVTTGVAIHHLLYDAHGSTRAILDSAAAFVQQFAYSAYGQMLTSTNLTAASAALTNILYSGEWTQANGQQYLRARFYDPSSGRFNRLDPFAGNASDPLSLHRYAYVHGNPIMGIDPSGEFALVVSLATISIGAFFQAALLSNVARNLRANTASLATVLPWIEYEASIVVNGQQIGEPLNLAVWLGLSGDKSRLAPIAQFMGTALLNDANARAWYLEQLTKLKSTVGEYSPARNQIKISARGRLTPIGQAWTESFNKARGLTSDVRQAGRSVASNRIANEVAFREFRPIGGALLVIGAGISIYNIATANDPYRQLAVEGGTWAGALSGGYVGAQIGATIGSLPIFLPWGPFVGAIAGGVIGSWGLGQLGTAAGGNYYDFFVPAPQIT